MKNLGLAFFVLTLGAIAVLAFFGFLSVPLAVGVAVLHFIQLLKWLMAWALPGLDEEDFRDACTLCTGTLFALLTCHFISALMVVKSASGVGVLVLVLIGAITHLTHAWAMSAIVALFERMAKKA